MLRRVAQPRSRTSKHAYLQGGSGETLAIVLGLTLAPVFPGIADPPATAKPGPPCTSDGSGGRTVAHLAGGKRIGSRSVNAHAPEACLYRTGFFAAEPTLGIDAEGRIFFQTLDANEWPAFPVEVIRSTDEGRTWESVAPSAGPVRRHPYTEDPYVYVDPATGRVFTVDYLLPCSELSFSDDAGESWITVPMGCELVDHQTIFAGPPVSSTPVGEYPNIVYYCAADIGLASNTAISACLKSLNGGLTFMPTGQPAFVYDPGAGNPIPVDSCNGLHAHGVVGHDGTVYLPKGHCGQPWLAISKDEGASWTRVQVADNGTPTHEAGVAVDDDGNIYYTWIGINRLPYLAVSRDGGETWSKPMMIGAPGVNEASLPGIAVGAPGKLAIVHMGTTNSPGEPWEGPYADTTWNGYMTMSVTALEKNPVFYSGSVNDPADPFIQGTCGPFRCQAAFDFLDIVIAPDGTPWASFVDGCFDNECAHTGPILPRVGEGVAGRLIGGPSLLPARARSAPD